MKIFGLPKDYDEILQRIFYTSFATGFACTIVLVKASPALQKFIDSINTSADIGFIRNIPVLYVLIPLLIGVFSRLLILHDMISDVFRIRYLFDTRCLLFPLAKGVGLTVTKDLQKKISSNRVNSMKAVFYKFAEFENPVIDKHLVRTAVDNWGWFWVLVESSFLITVTAFIFGYMQKWNYVFGCLIALLVELIFILIYWLRCQKGGARQVSAIILDKSRKKSIAKYFRSL
jgi:hypothetical protein